MATAPAIHGPKSIWNVRGTWSAKDDRLPSAVWLGILWLGMLVGFGLDFSRFLHENPPAPRVLTFHAIVFTGWMLLLTAQVLLVLGNRIAWHRRMGWLLAFWACMMLVLGPWASLASQAVSLHTPSSDTPFLALNFVNISFFAIFVAWGIALRKNPAAHRRMMILSTVAIADPGFARISGYVMPNEPQNVILWFFYTFYGNVLLIALMTAWDWWRGRLIRSFVVGASALLTAEAIGSVLYFWAPWRAASLALAQFWARHFF